jgi:hypothetical protein
MLHLLLISNHCLCLPHNNCRWALQALYISWLVPASPDRAPATAAFLAQLGYCGLEPQLLQALQSPAGGAEDRAQALNTILTTGGWCLLRSMPDMLHLGVRFAGMLLT